MRIDWKAGRWRIFDESGNQVADVANVVVVGEVHFVIVDNSAHGIAVTKGQLTVTGDRAIIREPSHGESRR